MYHFLMQDASRYTAPKNRGIILWKRQRLTRPTPTRMPSNFEQPKYKMASQRNWVVEELTKSK